MSYPYCRDGACPVFTILETQHPARAGKVAASLQSRLYLKIAIKNTIHRVETGHAPSFQNVTLKVYDILGSEVATLVSEQKSPGNYEVKFNGSNLPSGVYIYQLKSGNFIETKKLMLIK